VIHPRTLFLAVTTALAIGVAAVPASAQPADSPPSEADITAAKKAFGEGKKLFETKKYGLAVDKFKESYRLSKRPTLLYNIAISLDENKQKDMALFYYRKFLTDAPADDEQRPLAETRVKALETELGPDAGKPDGGTSDGGKPDGGKPDGGKPDGGKPDGGKTVVKIKPAGTYTAADFKHRIVEEAPPGKPLDLTAVVPEDSGFVVTLFYRGAGEASFTPAQMKWRYNELVGRIPAAKMSGTSVQYYVEVKDPAGTVVTRVAKPASPNVVYLDTSASSQFYPDWNPDTAGAGRHDADGGKVDGSNGHHEPIDNEDPLKDDTSDDPLHLPKGGRRVADNSNPGGGADHPMPSGPGGTGFMDVGSSKFTATKWGTTIVGTGLLATSILFYVRASNSASTLEQEANRGTCFDGSPGPCEFDQYLRDAQSTGQTAETISKVTFGIGIAVTAVATYYWIKQLRGGPRHEKKSQNAARERKRTFIAAPAIGEDVIGGTAAWEW